jgi:hypothetical protein bfra3_11831|nr:MAG TPA: hypothetical protein [Caudoviricetes sp.]
MVIQYPHYLFALTTGESMQDENGYWTEEEGEFVFLSKCREETDGRGQEIQAADGTYHKFSSIVQIPKGDLMIKEGTEVYVANKEDGTDIRIKGIALKFDKGQLHSRLWI